MYFVNSYRYNICSIIYKIGNEAIIMKKSYNSPELEIYELNEAIMDEPYSNKDDEVEGDGSDLLL